MADLYLVTLSFHGIGRPQRINQHICLVIDEKERNFTLVHILLKIQPVGNRVKIIMAVPPIILPSLFSLIGTDILYSNHTQLNNKPFI